MGGDGLERKESSGGKSSADVNTVLNCHKEKGRLFTQQRLANGV